MLYINLVKLAEDVTRFQLYQVAELVVQMQPEVRHPLPM